MMLARHQRLKSSIFWEIIWSNKMRFLKNESRHTSGCCGNLSLIISDFYALIEMLNCRADGFMITVILKSSEGRWFTLKNTQSSQARAKAAWPTQGQMQMSIRYVITDPGQHWPLIGRVGSRDLNTGLWLVSACPIPLTAWEWESHPIPHFSC